MGNTNQAAAVRMKHFIDSHLREPVTAKMIADAAGYSQFHAARIFKEVTGRTPFEYLRERRLLGSAFALRNTGARVVDVAFDFVFDSHEGFTRSFTKAFGVAPKRFAAASPRGGWHIPYRVSSSSNNKMEATKMSEKTAIIFTQIVERPARKLILCRCKSADNYFDYCEEEGCCENGNSVPWETLAKIKEALYEPVGLWLPENMVKPGTGTYAHGVEVPADYAKAIPEGFDVIDLPPCKLIVFQGEPFDDSVYDEAISELWERVAKFNPEVYGYEYADELAPKMQLAPYGWRGYIEMRPIRQLTIDN